MMPYDKFQTISAINPGLNVGVGLSSDVSGTYEEDFSVCFLEVPIDDNLSGLDVELEVRGRAVVTQHVVLQRLEGTLSEEARHIYLRHYLQTG